MLLQRLYRMSYFSSLTCVFCDTSWKRVLALSTALPQFYTCIYVCMYLFYVNTVNTDVLSVFFNLPQKEEQMTVVLRWTHVQIPDKEDMVF